MKEGIGGLFGELTFEKIQIGDIIRSKSGEDILAEDLGWMKGERTVRGLVVMSDNPERKGVRVELFVDEVEVVVPKKIN